MVEFGRQCVFAASVNAFEYLRDETGGRRFWTVATGRIDLAGLEDVRDQLWVEARDRFLAEETWWIDDEALNQSAAEEQERRCIPDPWEAPISGFLAGRDKVTVDDILALAVSVPIEERDQRAANRVAACLRVLGWRRHQQRAVAAVIATLVRLLA